jgi:hypothetical protein
VSVFDEAKTELRELLALVVEIDRVSRLFAQGGAFDHSAPDHIVITTRRDLAGKQARAHDLREKYGLY